MNIQEYIKSFHSDINMADKSGSGVMEETVFSTRCHRDSELVSGRFPVKKFESAIREAFTFFDYKEGRDFIISRDADNHAVHIKCRNYSSDIDGVIFGYIHFMRIALEKGKRKGVAEGCAKHL